MVFFCAHGRFSVSIFPLFFNPTFMSSFCVPCAKSADTSVSTVVPSMCSASPAVETSCSLSTSLNPVGILNCIPPNVNTPFSYDFCVTAVS